MTQFASADPLFQAGHFFKLGNAARQICPTVPSTYLVGRRVLVVLTKEYLALVVVHYVVHPEEPRP